MIAERRLAIGIGTAEAQAIECVLEGQATLRPLTVDLTLRLLVPVGVTIERVVIHKLIERTFYAEITIAHSQQRYAIDGRPSDALALAMRTHAPLYVTRAIVETVGGDPTQPSPAERVAHDLQHYEQRLAELS